MAETTTSDSTRAPWHLWVVGILGFLWNAMGCFDYVMTKTSNAAWLENFTPEMLVFFDSLPAWWVACWAIAVWGGLLGALLLLLRKKIAFHVLAVSLVSAILSNGYSFVIADGMAVMGTPGAIFSVVILVIAALLPWYAWAMTRRGVLS